MKTWEKRYFILNETNEVELKGVAFSHIFRGLNSLGWKRDDEFWAPDLQVSRFVRADEEIFVIEETYFDPKLTGDEQHIQELEEAISKIDPDEILYAGARPQPEQKQAEQVGDGDAEEAV
jgi:hypothetical protein